jgi:gliding motility-associated-like protein
VKSIVWTPITNLNCSDCATPVAAPKKTTTYRVDVENIHGCKNYDEMTVSVFCNNGNLFMPNTFSPNNDGSNDVYYPRGKGLFRVKAFKIFNRWGELVFQKYDFSANDASKGWNGYYNNKPASPDVYVYSIDVICENNTVLNYRGNVALIR